MYDRDEGVAVKGVSAGDPITPAQTHATIWLHSAFLLALAFRRLLLFALLPLEQIQLITLLVSLGELPIESVREVYRLLGDDCHAIRHAASELVASMLEEMGRAALEGSGGTRAGDGSAARGRKGRGRGGAGGSKTGAAVAATEPNDLELQLAGVLALQAALAHNTDTPDTSLASLAAKAEKDGERSLGEDAVRQVSTARVASAAAISLADSRLPLF